LDMLRLPPIRPPAIVAPRPPGRPGIPDDPPEDPPLDEVLPGPALPGAPDPFDCPAGSDPPTTSLTYLTEPGFGNATRARVRLPGAGSVWYGNDLPCTVVGASGSDGSSKLRNVAKPDVSLDFAGTQPGLGLGSGDPATRRRSLPNFFLRS